MARPKKKDDVQQLKPMDFEGAVRLYRNDIKPAVSNSATELKDAADGYKAIKKVCHIQPQSAKAAFKAFEMEDAKRDDYLRGFVGVLNAIMGSEVLSFHNADLVDVAEGKADTPKSRGRPNLVAVNTAPKVSDGVDDDLVRAAEDVTGEPAAGTGGAAIAAMKAAGEKPEFDEASEEELAQQQGRGDADADADADADED